MPKRNSKTSPKKQPSTLPRTFPRVTHPAQKQITSTPTLDGLAKVAQHCKACGLWKSATQTVFGEGKAHLKVMFAGEGPGDREELARFVEDLKTIAKVISNRVK